MQPVTAASPREVDRDRPTPHAGRSATLAPPDNSLYPRIDDPGYNVAQHLANWSWRTPTMPHRDNPKLPVPGTSYFRDVPKLRVPGTSHIVIPARLASTRLPGKLLLDETGVPLIRHTYESALKARRPDGVCVATDHQNIFDAVRTFGGDVYMTDPNAASGTDRVAEVARQLPEVDIFVNVQGDEPDISGESIDLAVRLLEENPSTPMATLATPIRTREQFDDPACVKVVFDSTGRAMYFSRSPIPHPRTWNDDLLTANPPCFFQHVGLYAYRRNFLLHLAEMPPSQLEQLEKLEQLRVIEAGYPIMVGVVDEPTFGIDTPEDYRAFVEKRRAG